jgi:uncharacterized damage-inducible protein DinB
MNPLIETWQIHNRIHLYLLDAIATESLNDQAASKGRTVGEQFAHIHNVRLMWLKSAAPELLESLLKLEKDMTLTVSDLKTHLSQSSEAIEKVINMGLETGKVKGFKPHPTAFVGYLIAHEAHHRGQITLSLKQSGHPIDKKTQFGLWEWGSR